MNKNKWKIMVLFVAWKIANKCLELLFYKYCMSLMELDFENNKIVNLPLFDEDSNVFLYVFHSNFKNQIVKQIQANSFTWNTKKKF